MAFTPPLGGSPLLPGSQRPLSPRVAQRGPPSAVRHAPGGLGAALRGRSGQYEPGQRYDATSRSVSASSAQSPSPVRVICGPSRTPSPRRLASHQAACSSAHNPRQVGMSVMAVAPVLTPAFPQALVLPGTIVAPPAQSMLAKGLVSPRLGTTRRVMTHSSVTHTLYTATASARCHPWPHPIPTPAAALRVSSPMKVSGHDCSLRATVGTPSAWTPACSGVPLPQFTAIRARTPSPQIARSSLGERPGSCRAGRSISMQPGSCTPMCSPVHHLVEPVAAVVQSQGPPAQTWLVPQEDSTEDPRGHPFSTRGAAIMTGSCSCSAPSVVDLPDASSNVNPGHSHPSSGGRTPQANAAKLFCTVPLASKDVPHQPPTSPHGFGWPSNFFDQVPGTVTSDTVTDTVANGSEAEALLSSASAVGQASVASSSTTAAVGSAAGEQESCENSQLAALERRCLHLEQSLVASELEKERLTSRLRHLEENSAYVARVLQHKEEQVGELNLQNTKLARALMEVTAGASTSAACSGAGSPYVTTREARVFEGTEVLQSPDDEEEHLGNVSTLAALRERLYREYDAKVNRGIASSTGGGTEAATSPPGSPDCRQERQETKAAPPPSPAPAPLPAMPTQRPPDSVAQSSSARYHRLG